MKPKEKKSKKHIFSGQINLPELEKELLRQFGVPIGTPMGNIPFQYIRSIVINKSLDDKICAKRKKDPNFNLEQELYFWFGIPIGTPKKEIDSALIRHVLFYGKFEDNRDKPVVVQVRKFLEEIVGENPDDHFPKK